MKNGFKLPNREDIPSVGVVYESIAITGVPKECPEAVNRPEVDRRSTL